MAEIEFKLQSNQVQALAQMLKRIGHSNIRPLACSLVEAEVMKYELINLRHYLKELGYDLC